jgi:GWxTD domain-containing protein
MVKHLCIFAILCYSISLAQFDKEAIRLDDRAKNPITFEAIPYWNDDTTTIELVVLYRMSPSFLFFTKANNLQREYFEAKGELIVEVMDSNNVTVERYYRPIRIQRNSMPAEDALPSDEIQGIFTFKLKKGFYKITAEAKDSGSGKSFINRDIKVDAQVQSAPGLYISPILFIDPVQFDLPPSNNPIFYPVNYGNNVIIGQAGACMFQVVSSDTNTNIQFAWKILRKNEDQDKFSHEFEGENYFLLNGTFTVIENLNKVSFAIKKGSACSRYIFIPIPVERLDAGAYSITVTSTQGTLKSVNESKFKVIWPLMPFSLSDPRLAVDVLKLIATEEEIDQMTAFNSDKSRKAFQTFWHKRNPDSTRAYNSTMAEYYRRVDESIKRYSTTNERDGYRTDRGRIYILFGAPSIINRLLKPNTVASEIWTYEKLNKRFTFKDLKKNSNYILVKTENN